jgi:hypothetical protein
MINNLLDCTYRRRGPLVWYMRRYGPGDRCWAWSFWRMEWYRARVLSQDRPGEFRVENLDIINNDGTFCKESSDDYRMRPRWYFWARRALVLAALYAAWRLS